MFAIGALDAYLSEVAAEVMMARFEHGQATGDGRKILETIQRTGPTLAIELAVAAPQVDRTDVPRRAIVAVDSIRRIKALNPRAIHLSHCDVHAPNR